jgi:hypothetical protein
VTVKLSIGQLLPALRAGDKPRFEFYGKEGIYEYLDACQATETVPEIMWVFWFGPEMSENRARAFSTMKQILEVPIILVDKDNLESFLKWPVHPGLEYLSGNHKSDYFRVYFMYHYGGAYSDIKHHKESWRKYWAEFRDPEVWMVGVPEIRGAFGVKPGVTYPPDYHEKMISNGFMIARGRNKFLEEVHRLQNEDLDTRLPQLIEHPSPDSGRCCPINAEGYPIRDPEGYPIRWAELMGELMAFVGQDYYQHFKRIIVMPHLHDYI